MRLTVVLLLAAFAAAVPADASCTGDDRLLVCEHSGFSGATVGVYSRQDDTFSGGAASATTTGVGAAAWSAGLSHGTGAAAAAGPWGASGGAEAVLLGTGPDFGFGANPLQPGAGASGCVRPVACIP